MSAQEHLRIVHQIPVAPGSVLFAEAAQLVDLAQNRQRSGREAVVHTLNALFMDAFDEIHVQPGISLADERSAMLELVFQGRQQRSFMGIPATGRWVQINMVIIAVFVESAVTRVSLFYDAGTILRQLGMITASPQAVDRQN
jgi:predicted ester cyclase